MKKNKIIVLAAVFAVSALFAACSKEEQPTPSDYLGIGEMYELPADADPRVKKIFEDYGVSVILDWDDWKTVYNSGLAINDVAIARNFIPVKVAPEHIDGAITFAQTLFSQCSPEVTRAFFPLEWWMVGFYGGGIFWEPDFVILGRNRFICTWPSLEDGMMEVTDPENHYYIDRKMARTTWDNMASIAARHMEEPIKEFVEAGRAYDDGEAMKVLGKQLDADMDAASKLEPETEADLLPGETLEEARERIRTQAEELALAVFNEAVEQLCIEGGFIPDVDEDSGRLSAGATNSFESDLSSWVSLIATESYANIKARYLDNSVVRTVKYNVIVDFFKDYNWDIQAAGNTYSQKNGQLAPPAEEP